MGPRSPYLNVDARSAQAIARQSPEARQKALLALEAGYAKLFPAPEPADPAQQAALASSDEMLTQSELAAWLKVSPETVRRWRAQRQGPPYLHIENKKGSPVRYYRPAVLLWLKHTCWVQPANPDAGLAVRFDARKTPLWAFADPLAVDPSNESPPTVEQVEAEWRAMGEEMGPPRIPTAAELRSLIEPEPAPTSLAEAVRASRARHEQAGQGRPLKARIEAARRRAEGDETAG